MKFTATFSTGSVSRHSVSHFYKTAAVATKDGHNYWNPVFSANLAYPVMPGDTFRRSAKASCYNAKEKAQLIADANAADLGWKVEVVEVSTYSHK